MTDDNRGFLETAIDDGRPLLILSALFLVGCGIFAIFQAATGHFLPHDTVYLDMRASGVGSIAVERNRAAKRQGLEERTGP